MIRINLSKILGEKRITQKRLAEMANVRPNAISTLYNEKAQRVDLDILERICRALECTPGDLLELVDDE